jgi:tRNA A37 threonylcarbamoyladenosine modification protein TsaB
LPKHSVDIVVIPISKPLLVGVYKNGELIETIRKDGMTSDILPEIFDDLLKKYDLKHIIYAKGPGSFMAIKLAYVFFKTLEIAKDIKLLAQDGFYFNNNSPIKAVGNSYFVKKEGIITLEKNLKEGEFKLPEKLNLEDFSEETSPLYVLKAV